MYRSYPDVSIKRFSLANSAPTMLVESWTDARHREPSASNLFTNLHYLLNRGHMKPSYFGFKARL